jgi:hypothetical protein
MVGVVACVWLVGPALRLGAANRVVLVLIGLFLFGRTLQRVSGWLSRRLWGLIGYQTGRGSWA